MPRAARSSRRWALGLVAASGLLGACSSRPLAALPGRQSEAAPVSLFSVDWWTPLVEGPPLEFAPREVATPAVSVETGRVVALTRDGYVRALSPEGRVEWSFRTEKPFNAGALLHEGTVYVPGGDGVLYALEARTGELRWKYATGEELSSMPVLDGERVLVASAADTLYALERGSGKWLWQYRRDAPSGFTVRGVSTPVVSGGLVFLGFSDGHVVALDGTDGTARWQRALSTPGTSFLDVDTTPVLDEDGRLYVASYKDGLYALEAQSGRTVWRTPAAGITSLISQGEVLFAAGDQQLGAYRAEDGRSVWTLGFEGRALQRPVFTRGMLVVPTQRALVFVDAASGKRRLSWDPGKGVSAPPRRVGPHLYVLSNLGYLYAMRLSGDDG